MKRVRALVTGTLVGACLTLLCVAGYVVSTAPAHYTVLFIGSDQRGTERARSDILVLMSIPRSADGNATMISIPRDTKIDDAEYGLQKITHFYALGERPDDGKMLGSVDLTRQAVEGLLGISIDATVEASFSSFEDIVDALGGGCVNSTCGATGSAALKIIRDRFSEGRTDFSRQSDSQSLISSLLAKLRTPENLQRILRFFKDSSTARLQYDRVQLMHFVAGYTVHHGGRFAVPEMTSLTIPGSSDMIYTDSFGKALYYWIPDVEATNTLVDTYLR